MSNMSDILAGHITIIVLVIAQCIMFLVNSILKLNLPIEQVWFPVILFLVIEFIGLMMMAFGRN